MDSSSEASFLAVSLVDFHEALNVVDAWLCPALLLGQALVEHLFVKHVADAERVALRILLVLLEARTQVVLIGRRQISLPGFDSFLGLFLADPKARSPLCVLLGHVH